MIQLDLFDEAPTFEWWPVIEELHHHALVEIHAMAEHARRSIGQMTRFDHIQHRVEKEMGR